MAAATETAIRARFKRGGRLFATDQCVLGDYWMRQRTDYAFADLFGTHFSNAFEDAHHDAIVRNPATGCVLLPGQWGQADCCRIPADRVAREIKALLPAALPVVHSPVPQVGCAWSRLPDGSHLLSLLNYGDEPVRGLAITGQPAEMFDATGPVTGRPPVLDVELFLRFPS